jgi:uncharacterized damage-inducible protein DinB
MTYYGAKELAESFRTVRKNTIIAAEDIPADQYGFSAAANLRTVEKLLTHIALGYRFQYQIQAVEKRNSLEGFNFPALMQQLIAEEAKPRTKAEVIALLKAEGEIWAKFLEGLSEDFLSQPVSTPPGGIPAAKSRFEMILSVKEHEMHHRGQIMIMQRMLGVVPHLTREMQARMAAQASTAR